MPTPFTPSSQYGNIQAFYGNIRLAHSTLTPFKWGAWEVNGRYYPTLYRERWIVEEKPVEAPQEVTAAPSVPAAPAPPVADDATIARIYQHLAAINAMKTARLRREADTAAAMIASEQAEKAEKESRRQRKKRFDDENEAFFLLMN